MRGPKIWRAIEPRKNFLKPPEAPPEVTFRGSNVFLLQFQYKKTLANCNKAPINDGCSSCNFRGGLLQAPLNPLKTDVLQGPPGLSGGPGPLGLHRNSTTDSDNRDVVCRI